MTYGPMKNITGSDPEHVAREDGTADKFRGDFLALGAFVAERPVAGEGAGGQSKANSPRKFELFNYNLSYSARLTCPATHGTG